MLLLLCQTAFAAQASAHGFTSQVATSVGAPCHEMAGDGSDAPPGPAAASTCEVSKAVAEAVKVPALSVTDMPVVALVRYEIADVRLSSYAQRTIVIACSAPPLNLLHCRFLN